MSEHFQPFPKIPRLFRDITITEKIDGTNGQIVIEKLAPNVRLDPVTPPPGALVPCLSSRELGWSWPYNLDRFIVRAGSRNRWVDPLNDNAGFAAWVYGNAEALANTLGEGQHFGEWWGSGIQRGYGLNEKRFSLFNTKRWQNVELTLIPGLSVVPVLYQGPFSQWHIRRRLFSLEGRGSVAAPGYLRPEGIMVYHHAANSMFKVTLEDDEAPKTKAIAA